MGPGGPNIFSFFLLDFKAWLARARERIVQRMMHPDIFARYLKIFPFREEQEDDFNDEEHYLVWYRKSRCFAQLNP